MKFLVLFSCWTITCTDILIFLGSKMLNIKNIAALAAVLSQIEVVIAEQPAYAQCKCRILVNMISN